MDSTDAPEIEPWWEGSEVRRVTRSFMVGDVSCQIEMRFRLTEPDGESVMLAERISIRSVAGIWQTSVIDRQLLLYIAGAVYEGDLLDELKRQIDEETL